MADTIEPLEIEIIQVSQPNSPPITPQPARILGEHSVLLHPEQEKKVVQPRREHKVHLAPELSEVDTPTYPNNHQKLYRIRSDLILVCRNLYDLERSLYRLKRRTRVNSICIALLFVLIIPIALLSILALIYYFHYL